MSHFKNLLERYLNKTASEEERTEFLELLESGNHDHEISRQDMMEIMITDEGPILEQTLVNNAFGRIRTEYNMKGEEDEPVYQKKVWLAAAAVITLAMVAVLWMMRSEKFFSDQLTEQHADPELVIYKGKQVADLPDGTRIVLNENSVLSFEPSFGKSNREVTLTGEATFDVTHDASKPFLVHTGKVVTKVLGTEFNINAYPGQRTITVTVLRGLVEVGDEKRVYGKIRPNEQIAVDLTSDNFTQQKADAENAVKWKSKFLILDDVDLEKAAAIIGEKFNVKISIANDNMKPCHIDGTFLNDESLEDVLMLVCKVINAEYKMEQDGDVVLSGSGCN